MAAIRFFAGRLQKIWAQCFRPKEVWTEMSAKNEAIPEVPLQIKSIETYAEYMEYQDAMADEYARRSKIESRLAQNKKLFQVSGYCAICQKPSWFHVDYQSSYPGPDGQLSPNWRERLVCQYCGLNNRMRASLHVFYSICNPSREQAIYITEQTTPGYAWLCSKFSCLVGSEYLGEHPPLGQKNLLGIRNESLRGLSFADKSFDYLLCFDVLEHIVDYAKALQECLRVLKPGGVMFFSVPFERDSPHNIVRAYWNSQGEIRHVLPPEYHGDPINDKGCLCFYHFGWELLDEIRAAGFAKACALFYWSQQYAYLGQEQCIFMAQK